MLSTKMFILFKWNAFNIRLLKKENPSLNEHTIIIIIMLTKKTCKNYTYDLSLTRLNNAVYYIIETRWKAKRVPVTIRRNDHFVVR